MARVAVLAGKGGLPEFFIRRASAKGHEIVVIDLAGGPRPTLAHLAKACYSLPLGQWQMVLDILHREGISDVYLLGGFSKTSMFGGVALDGRVIRLLAGLKEKNDNAVIEAFVQDLAGEGINVRPQTDLLEDALLGPGVLTTTIPSKEVWEDIAFGFKMAKSLAQLDIGQTVVVKGGAVLAVEAIDGTDATIGRGGGLAGGGGVAVKISKPHQDPRFDVPTIGLDTIETVINSGLSAIALEAGKTIIVHVGDVVKRADEGHVSVVLVG